MCACAFRVKLKTSTKNRCSNRTAERNEKKKYKIVIKFKKLVAKCWAKTRGTTHLLVHVVLSLYIHIHVLRRNSMRFGLCVRIINVYVVLGIFYRFAIDSLCAIIMSYYFFFFCCSFAQTIHEYSYLLCLFCVFFSFFVLCVCVCSCRVECANYSMGTNANNKIETNSNASHRACFVGPDSLIKFEFRKCTIKCNGAMARLRNGEGTFDWPIEKLFHEKWWKCRMFEQTSAGIESVGIRQNRKRSRRIAQKGDNTGSLCGQNKSTHVFEPSPGSWVRGKETSKLFRTQRLCMLFPFGAISSRIPTDSFPALVRLFVCRWDGVISVYVSLFSFNRLIRPRRRDSPLQLHMRTHVRAHLLRLRSVLMQWSTRFRYRKLQMSRSRCNRQTFMIIDDGGGGGHTRRCAIFRNGMVSQLNVVTMAMTYLGNV